MNYLPKCHDDIFKKTCQHSLNGICHATIPCEFQRPRKTVNIFIGRCRGCDHDTAAIVEGTPGEGEAVLTMVRDGLDVRMERDVTGWSISPCICKILKEVQNGH